MALNSGGVDLGFFKKIYLDVAYTGAAKASVDSSIEIKRARGQKRRRTKVVALA